jgi:hypothetical protein
MCTINEVLLGGDMDDWPLTVPRFVVAEAIADYVRVVPYIDMFDALAAFLRAQGDGIPVSITNLDSYQTYRS